MLGGALHLLPALAPVAPRVWAVGLVVTGVPVVWGTLREIAAGRFGGDVVASLSIVTALLLGQSLAGLVIVLMQTGGETLEAFAAGRASTAVRELEAVAPRTAHRVTDDGIEDIGAHDAVVGDVLLVRPGELIPCDAIVLEGRSAVDVSRLTGEPLPLDAKPGERLASGSGNGAAPLRVRVTALAHDSQYARIVELVRRAQADRAPIQRIADRYAVWFTPLTLAVCALTWIASRDPLRVLAVLVVATPCPLILATPVAIIGGINRAARRHIVVRSGGALEQLGGTDVAVLDKTGTLTLGRPEVERVRAASGWDESSLLRLAGAVERQSGHLLARSLVDMAERAGGRSRLSSASDVVETAGRGVTGEVEGRHVSVGSRSYVVEVQPDAEADVRVLEAGLTAGPAVRAFVAVDGKAAGVVEYADRIRDDARELVQELRRLGFRRVVLLSGDNAANVAAVAEQIGVDETRAELHPADKVAETHALLRSGGRVLVVGDGINDAPAMAAATVGVALAAHGGGITAEAAGVVLLADDLARIPEVIRISRKTMSVARQSLVVGLGLSAVAMVFAALGAIRPAAGALIQETIDVAVILNALRTSR